MRNENPLKKKVKLLRKNGTLISVGSFKERAQCFNIAGRLGMELSTRKKLDGSGFEVRRTK